MEDGGIVADEATVITGEPGRAYTVAGEFRPGPVVGGPRVAAGREHPQPVRALTVRPATGLPPWRFGDRGPSHGYHSWNAYCGRALPAGPASVPPHGPVTRVDPLRPGPTGGQPHPGEASIVTAYRWRLREVHRLAEQLDHLRPDPRFTGIDPALPVELHHELADAVELLTDVYDSFPTGRAGCAPGRVERLPGR